MFSLRGINFFFTGKKVGLCFFGMEVMNCGKDKGKNSGFGFVFSLECK